MTTVNMKDYVNGNANENKAVQEVIGNIGKKETKVSVNIINTCLLYTSDLVRFRR